MDLAPLNIVPKNYAKSPGCQSNRNSQLPNIFIQFQLTENNDWPHGINSVPIPKIINFRPFGVLPYFRVPEISLPKMIDPSENDGTPFSTFKIGIPLFIIFFIILISINQSESECATIRGRGGGEEGERYCFVGGRGGGRRGDFDRGAKG